jgi:hypothetical protein
MRVVLLALWMVVSAQTQTNESWKKLDFLLGDWVGVAGEKDGQLGPGQGDYSFRPELKEKIIVRRNHAGYDSGAEHDDLMIIYLDGAPRAIYFDTEGHVIRYNLSFPAPQHAVFESESGQPGPKYRLSYRMESGVLKGRFETAPPGGDYKTYLSWTSKKRSVGVR